MSPRAREARHELTGIITCGRCGRTMAAHRNTMRGKRLDTYAWRCQGRTYGTCDHTNTVSDRMVREAVHQVLTQEYAELADIEAEAGQHDPPQLQRRDRAGEITAELDRITSALDRLTERYVEDQIPQDAYERTRDRYLARRAELESERDQAADEPEPVDYVAVVRDLLDEWDTLPVHRRNALLRDAVEITAYRQDRRSAHVVIRTVWGSEYTADAAEPMGAPRLRSSD